MRYEPVHRSRFHGSGGLIRDVGRRPDGDKGVMGGHALRRADNDTPYNFSYLFVCYIPVVRLNHYYY